MCGGSVTSMGNAIIYLEEKVVLQNQCQAAENQDEDAGDHRQDRKPAHQQIAQAQRQRHRRHENSGGPKDPGKVIGEEKNQQRADFEGELQGGVQARGHGGQDSREQRA